MSEQEEVEEEVSYYDYNDEEEASLTFDPLQWDYDDGENNNEARGDAAANMRSTDMVESLAGPLKVNEEEEAAPPPGALPLLPAPPDTDDPNNNNTTNMQLTISEIESALLIKATIESTACPEINNLSDMMYAQLAIVTNGNLEEALEIATKTQSFKEEYKVLDTLEDALRHIPDIYLPAEDNSGDRYILSIYPDPTPTTNDNGGSGGGGGTIIVFDISQLDLRRCNRSQEHLRRYFAGIYYLCLLLQPDFTTTRAGVINLVECSGFRWKQFGMMDMNFFKRQMNDTAGIFPVKMQTLSFFNSPMLFNTMISMSKSTLPPKVSDTFQVGMKLPMGDRLTDIYNLPTKKYAQQRVVEDMQNLLKRRYHNEQNFVLSPLLMDKTTTATTSSSEQVTEGTETVGTEETTETEISSLLGR